MAGGVSGSWAWVAGTQGEAGASGSVTTDRVGGGAWAVGSGRAVTALLPVPSATQLTPCLKPPTGALSQVLLALRKQNKNNLL